MEMATSVVLFICNHGYGNRANEEAQKAGARGGTIIHGHSLISKSKEKFLGITIHPEKDILMIVCLKSQTDKLMKAMSASYGTHSEAKGICFAMDVDQTLGFNFDAPLPIKP